MILELKETFIKERDEALGQKQSRYMREKFAFLGIAKPKQQDLERIIFKKYPLQNEIELQGVITALWEEKEREYQYTALAFARKYQKFQQASFIEIFEGMIRKKSWWDTVDDIASNLVGPLVMKHDLKGIMEIWIEDPCLWIRRTALLYQLKYKEKTDFLQLFRFCEKVIGESDFFIKKAIGWALREYSKTNPKAVLDFIEKNRNQLNSLSLRESSRYLL